jgi:ATP-dependent DNA helicase HFM1/MER3
MACKSKTSLTLQRCNAVLVGTLGLDLDSQFKSMLPSTTSVSYHKFILLQLLTNLSFTGRAPFDAPYRVQPASLTGANRLSLAPRNIYHQSNQEPRTLSNADKHFRFAHNLREGVPVSHAPPRANNMQGLGPMRQQRNDLFSQQPSSLQSLDRINQLSNAILMQKSMSPSQTKPEPANFFQGLPPNRINQLPPQRQQVTPLFNLS